MLAFLLSAGMLATAAEPADAEAALADRVTQLVKQLDAHQLVDRDQAERALLALGDAALPLLPQVDDDTPAEVALRLGRVQQKLLEAQALAAANPSVVTLSGKQMPLADVLAEIQKQTGNTIVDYRADLGQEPTDAKLDVDFDKTPFWKALDDVLDQANLALYPYSGEEGAYVVNQTGRNAPDREWIVYSGIFRLEPVRIEAARDLRGGDMQSLRLYVEITWEPRLQPFAMLQPFDEVTASDESGRPIAVTAMNAMPEATIRAGMSAIELEIPLELPDRDTKKIASLKGKLLALVPGPTQDFRFTSLKTSDRNTPAPRMSQRKAGATVSIDRLRKNNAAWELRMRVKFDSPSTALESHRGWILDNDVFFVNAEGRQFMPGGFEQSRQANDEVGINYYFDLPDGPNNLDLVYRTPIAVLETSIEYELRDLPLP